VLLLSSTSELRSNRLVLLEWEMLSVPLRKLLAFNYVDRGIPLPNDESAVSILTPTFPMSPPMELIQQSSACTFPAVTMAAFILFTRQQGMISQYASSLRVWNTLLTAATTPLEPFVPETKAEELHVSGSSMCLALLPSNVHRNFLLYWTPYQAFWKGRTATSLSLVITTDFRNGRTALSRRV
jgi:hypothetical protein